MISIPISIEKDIPPPRGNGFPVYVHSVTNCTPWIVDSGLTFNIIRTSLDVSVESLGSWIVLGWTLEGGRLKVVVTGDKPQPGDKVATVWLSETKKPGVRFIETADEGGRVIRGDAQPIKTGD